MMNRRVYFRNFIEKYKKKFSEKTKEITENVALSSAHTQRKSIENSQNLSWDNAILEYKNIISFAENAEISSSSKKYLLMKLEKDIDICEHNTEAKQLTLQAEQLLQSQKKSNIPSDISIHLNKNILLQMGNFSSDSLTDKRKKELGNSQQSLSDQITLLLESNSDKVQEEKESCNPFEIAKNNAYAAYLFTSYLMKQRNYQESGGIPEGVQNNALVSDGEIEQLELQDKEKTTGIINITELKQERNSDSENKITLQLLYRKKQTLTLFSSNKGEILHENKSLDDEMANEFQKIVSLQTGKPISKEKISAGLEHIRNSNISDEMVRRSLDLVA